MKVSKFNTFFYYEGKQVGYNALNNDFIILMPELHQLFLAAVNENVIDELANIHPSFFELLKSKGFIVENDFEELAEVKRIVKEIDQENEFSYQLTINPTMNCNFKCWYCYETHIRKSKMSEETQLSVLKLIANIADEKKDLKNFSIHWFGGEPLLYFENTVVPILEGANAIASQKGFAFSTGFTTNGYLLDQKKLDKCKMFNVDHFQITLDGHRERHNMVRFVANEKGTYDEIVKNIKLAVNNGFSVTVRLNISKETIEENIESVMNDFDDLTEDSRRRLFFSFHEVWQIEQDLSDDIIDIVKNFREDGLNTSFKADWDFMRKSCYADKRNHATINYNGDLFKCTARDFESRNREGYLDMEGRLVWNEKFESRMDAKFKNKPCLDCRMLPICNGGCSQQALEHMGVEYCVNNFDEAKKTQLVKEKFLFAISN
ncbi:radical SAM/SPASM domain-containing protein [Sphingobacterium mizutaii]|uniref:radical SAM/SPASM domain-containing protein n=1 Tax=Sphingobacterium mizutaii TaxID=1010 RepID=UPI00162437B4|nr:radical SAM protein [Sphingobacterium mizutaii]